jgi:hypothetical protein
MSTYGPQNRESSRLCSKPQREGQFARAAPENGYGDHEKVSQRRNGLQLPDSTNTKIPTRFKTGIENF